MPVALIPLLTLAPADAFRDAVALWHFPDLRDSAGDDSALVPHGGAEVGVALEGDEREASLARGGDGLVARCEAGCFLAGQGAGGELNLRGEAMTLLIRLRDPRGIWDGSLLSKHGGHEKLVYNLFSADLGGGMIIGFELGTERIRSMVQVKAPVRFIDPTAWHDLILRYDGRRLALFVDGALLDEVAVEGSLRQGNTAPCWIGAESADETPRRPFTGLIDHAALWQRALSDAEVAALSGGPAAAEARRASFEALQREERSRMHERAAADPLRPRYHFRPEAGWLNDPNGMIHFGGQYHMFYQADPDSALPTTKYWGHAVSDDLVHWRHLPIALSPDPGSPDAGGVWSGSAIDADGVLTLIYTGVMPECQCLARATDGVVGFAKDPANPVIAAPPAELQTTGFRDPCIWKQDGVYHLVVGSGIQDVGGTALHYRSADLRAWEYLGPLCVGDKAETGVMWECPDFFPLGDRHCLVCSPYGPPIWQTGTYDGLRFAPTRRGQLDFGGYWYAPQECEAPDGRHIIWGWCWEARPTEAQGAAGWAGIMSLPRELTLRPEGGVAQAPARELESLRGAAWRAESLTLADGVVQVLEPRGDQLELRLEATVPPGATLGLKLRATADGKEETLLVYDRDAGTLAIDRTQCSLDAATARDVQRGPLSAVEGRIALRVFVDRSVVEVFANSETCLTSRIYPTRPDALGLALWADGGTVEIEELTAWPMASIW